MNIDEILIRLLGRIEPWGETNEDNKRFENIENYRIALNFIIHKLSFASQYKDRPEYSMQKIGKECYDILKEYGIEL